jgi:hypothetical protein
MPAEIPSLLTVGQIAKQLGVDTHRVAYVIRSRRIQPCGRAGIFRVFDDPAVARIASELRRIQQATGNPEEVF